MNRSLALLALLAVLPARADFRYPDTRLQLFLPGAPWALTMPRDDWRVAQEQRKPDGSSIYYFVAGERGLQFSVYIDRTSECSSPASCLQLWRSKPIQGAKFVGEGERNGFSTVTYEIADAKVGDRSGALTNVSAHGYRDGHWIDLRVSAVGVTPPDAAPLLAFVDKLAFAPPELAGPRRYPVGASMAELDVPEGWREEPGPGRMQTLRFTPATGRDFMVLVTFIVSPAEKAAPGTPERSQANVRRAADMALQRSVEKRIDVAPLAGESAQGYYFRATDRSPEKGGFRQMSQGEVRSGSVTVTFTILANDGQDAAFQRAFEMIKSLRVR